MRLITIDNARERLKIFGGELKIDEVSEKEILPILVENFGELPQDRRMRYARLADGSLRFAIFMCRHDSEIVGSGSFNSVLSDAHNYYESKFAEQTGFDTKDQEALEIVSLVERIGYRDDKFEELKALCALIPREPLEIVERIEKIRTRIGFIANAGRFCYVTPNPIAMAAFQSAWSKWVEPNVGRFLQGLPEALLQPFQDRVSSAPPEVGAVVATFFRDWTTTTGPRIFESEADTRQFLALVTANPDVQVPIFRELVEAATDVQLGGEAPDRYPFGGPTSRRLLISLAEELAQFREYFHDAESILFRLANRESEPSIGNNATNTWKGLFRILLSGTSLPFSDRFKLLEQRAKSSDTRRRQLAVSAAAAAVDRQPFRMVGPPLFGSLLPPPEWKPYTYGEYYDAIESSVRLITEATSDDNDEVATAAATALLDATSHLLFAGFVEPVRKALEGKTPENLKPRVRAVVKETRARLDSPHVPETARRPQDRAPLDDWLKTLEPTTFHAQLVENLSSGAWTHHFDQEEWIKCVERLAKRLHANPELFTEEHDWLCSSEAKSATELGQFFGRLDGVKQAFLKEIVNKALQTNSDGFARGYIYGVSESKSTDFSLLNSELDRVQAINPKLAFYLMLPAGDAVHSFERALAIVSAGEQSVRLLSNLEVWVGNRKTTPQEAGRVVSYLLPSVLRGEREPADVALNFVAYQINRVPFEEKPVLIKEIFENDLDDFWMLLDAYVEDPGRETFWFGQTVRAAIGLDPTRGCELAARMAVNDNFSMKDDGEKLIREEISRLHPVQMMNAIGRLMIDQSNNRKFFIRKFEFFSALPLDVVTDWLERAGVEGARAIARHLEMPSVDKKGLAQVPPLTRFVLTRFEDDDRTFHEFLAGTHSLQTYVGSFANARAKEGEVAMAFINDDSKRIREWARVELDQSAKDVRVHRIREEELDL